MQRFCRQPLRNPQGTIGLLVAADDGRTCARFFQPVAMLDSTGQRIDPPDQWMVWMVEPRMTGADAGQNHALADVLRQVAREQHSIPRSVVVASSDDWPARRVERHAEVTQRQTGRCQLSGFDLSAQKAQNRRRDATGCLVCAA